MANVVKHRFASGKTDGADATQVQPSHWNDGHTFIGGATGDVLTRDTGDGTYGAMWTPPAQGPVLSWTPGVSGIGNVGTGWVIVTGKLAFVTATMVWPSNADGNPVQFTLPIAARSGVDNGLVHSYGPMQHRLWISNLSPALCYVLNAVTGAARLNSELSGQTFMVSGVYLLP